MEWLALALEDRFSGMLGEAALAVSELAEQRPLAGAISFVQVASALQHMPQTCRDGFTYSSAYRADGQY